MNVYSAYDNMLLCTGTIEEMAEEFEVSRCTIYVEIKKDKLPNLRRDFYFRTVNDKPLHREVIDVYDCDTWELLDTCYSIRDASEKYNMDWDVIYKNCQGDMRRATGSRKRFQKRML